MTNTPDSRQQELFFAVFEALPRQGPGSRACTIRALDLCGDLPPAPRILDLGCGAGAQTLHLAEATGGTIVAVDRHRPNVARLASTVAARGLTARIHPLVADFAQLPLTPPFDLIWSEGALYNLGLDRALPMCREWLRPGGHLAFTDAVWRRPDPPPDVAAAFADYPTMGRADDVVAGIRAHGFELLGHFPLPDEAWWTDFYTPMSERITELRRQCAGDTGALAILAQLAGEPEMHRRHGDCYGYEFFVARRR